MVEAGALKPVENDVQDVLNKFVVSIPQYKGHIYGLPFTAETVALICNKKMAPQPPTTFADLLNVMTSGTPVIHLKGLYDLWRGQVWRFLSA